MNHWFYGDITLKKKYIVEAYKTKHDSHFNAVLMIQTKKQKIEG